MTADPKSILAMNAYGGGAPDDPLLARRQKNFGAASVLFYDRPLEMARGAGCWMETTDGTRYLDFYNNVPSVGHCHPGVVEAVSRQIGRLNINSRYLVEGVERYIERLKATFPEEVSNVVLCCSGSEANDLALRIAQAATDARGVVVTTAAYHGNTAATTELSPSAWKRGGAPEHVRIVSAPSAAAYGDDISGGFAAAVAEAAVDLADAGHGLAALVCDTIFSSDGVYADPPGFLAPAAEAARAAGGLVLADEVQPGFARTGVMWGFARHGLAPDLVTMGKPMGNGFPMAGVAARPAHLAAFCDSVGYFNTFGGNPVAAAAGHAVLDAIEDEDLAGNALRVGATLREGLTALALEDERVKAVRGAGLFIGVELAQGGGADLTSVLTNALRERRVLIGAAGRYGETLKIRPPLCLTEDEAGFFLDAFADALRATPRGRVRPGSTGRGTETS